MHNTALIAGKLFAEKYDGQNKTDKKETEIIVSTNIYQKIGILETVLNNDTFKTIKKC